MSTSDVIQGLILLAAVIGAFSAQWITIQNQRDKDQDMNRLLIDALRTHTDMALDETHERINKLVSETATKSDLSAAEHRFAVAVDRFDAKLDRVNDKLDRMRLEGK